MAGGIRFEDENQRRRSNTLQPRSMPPTGGGDRARRAPRSCTARRAGVALRRMGTVPLGPVGMANVRVPGPTCSMRGAALVRAVLARATAFQWIRLIWKSFTRKRSTPLRRSRATRNAVAFCAYDAMLFLLSTETLEDYADSTVKLRAATSSWPLRATSRRRLRRRCFWAWSTAPRRAACTSPTGAGCAPQGGRVQGLHAADQPARARAHDQGRRRPPADRERQRRQVQRAQPPVEHINPNYYFNNDLLSTGSHMGQPLGRWRVVHGQVRATSGSARQWPPTFSCSSRLWWARCGGDQEGCLCRHAGGAGQRDAPSPAIEAAPEQRRVPAGEVRADASRPTTLRCCTASCTTTTTASTALPEPETLRRPPA